MRIRNAQDNVRDFHKKYGYANPDSPQLLAEEVWQFRKRLIEEELEEYLEACRNGDIVEIADALADLDYVVLGTAVSHGIDLQPIHEEVHASNMSKDVAKDGTTKAIKGPNYWKADVAGVLQRQVP